MSTMKSSQSCVCVLKIACFTKLQTMLRSASHFWIFTIKQLKIGSLNVSQDINNYFKQVFNKIILLDGDLGGYANAKSCYMKEKHRLIWERRHGPVGSGMRQTENDE